jgi:hypothetical protein
MMGSMSAPGVVSTNGLHRVELSLPADAQMLFLARMTAAAVATRAELDYEQVEDLRLAIDELCIALLGSGVHDGQIALLFQWDTDGVLDVVGTLIPGSDAGAKANGSLPPESALSAELSLRILDALVDDHGSDSIGGVHRAWLRVRRRESSQ